MAKLEKIISGGQTGADRGALIAAFACLFPHGGWCPKGRRAEDGKIPYYYDLKETESEQYPPRTWRNVRDSDGTAVFTQGPPERGSKLTIEFAKKQKKHWLHIDLSKATSAQASDRFKRWIERNKIHVCNVAGNRESKSPGIEILTAHIVSRAIMAIRSRTALPWALPNEKEDLISYHVVHAREGKALEKHHCEHRTLRVTKRSKK